MRENGGVPFPLASSPPLIIIVNNATAPSLSVLRAGMDMSDDEASPGVDDEEDDGPAADPSDDDKEHQREDDEHQMEDLKELEAARKERSDLMEAELSPKKGKAGKRVAVEGDEEEAMTVQDKFQFLVGQSEVFAHFLAGKHNMELASTPVGRLARRCFCSKQQFGPRI